MTLFLALCLGIGLALGVGLRPFLPALLIGALARGDIGIDFNGTDLSFLEQPVFLLALLIGVIALIGAERRLGPDRVEAGPIGAAVGGIALGLGALYFAGALAEEDYSWWPGLIAGIAFAGLAAATARLFFRRTRARLDRDAAVALPVYAEAAGVVVAGLAILFPPLALVALAFLAWLLLGQRRREGQKYAGLRVLR
ncbi:DUF4126 family protein [Conexibacter woesei]|uniref:DUF4126 domain-containing protein n=1 Tax=Conexibacter woesei (strain DSM 14684 / CCUG 47730 / CIP 108061 / JCM 11494 / NBRC 100937 / ID131577) TaxID=469383 RepID=D3F3W4_CONWI|nr:DUF4126 family protein [Conexibacter woesei]ADB54339.1 conserved hypothetical protein [Conexibacter woesei DSM 14684]